MDFRVIHEASERTRRIADENRQTLRQAGVFSVNLMGAAGCGKTALLQETIARLLPTHHVGVIVCDPETTRDANRLARYSDQLVQVDTGEGRLLEAGHIRDALNQLDLGQLDLLLIENISSTIGPAKLDLGEHARIGMFSVTEGDDKADKCADLVSRSDVLVLNKVDLLPLLPFDLDAFRADVRRLNPRSTIFEMSLLRGHGLEPWLKWLSDRTIRSPSHVSNWFG